MSGAVAVATVLASACVVLGGLVALVRAVWRIAQTLRDNTAATKALTGKLDQLASSIDGRFDALAARVADLEAGTRAGRAGRRGSHPGGAG